MKVRGQTSTISHLRHKTTTFLFPAGTGQVGRSWRRCLLPPAWRLNGRKKVMKSADWLRTCIELSEREAEVTVFDIGHERQWIFRVSQAGTNECLQVHRQRASPDGASDFNVIYIHNHSCTCVSGQTYQREHGDRDGSDGNGVHSLLARRVRSIFRRCCRLGSDFSALLYPLPAVLLATAQLRPLELTMSDFRDCETMALIPWVARRRLRRELW
jgi:hypothetical protein